MANEDSVLNTNQTEFIPLTQTGFLPESDVREDEALRHDYEKLRITYELQRDIGSEIHVDTVLNKILDRTCEFLKYDRAAILLVNKKGKLKLRAYRNLDKNHKLILSRTLIRHVLKKKTGVISSDVLCDERFNAAKSMIISGVRSSMAVPIVNHLEILGVIIIESYKRIAAFTKKDLHLIMNIANQTAQFIKNSLLHEELRFSFESAMRTLSAMVDARHPLTAGHSERVAALSVLIAENMDLSEDAIETIRFAGLLHDIGKIGIRDHVLLKKGTLEPHERAEMNNHASKTKSILENFHFPKSLRRVPEIAALHHEKIDGSGYPNGISGDEMPLEAKILAVADVFDALTSHRDYPRYEIGSKAMQDGKMTLSKALSILKEGEGRHFDPAVVKALERCLPAFLASFKQSHFHPRHVGDFIRAQAPPLLPELDKKSETKDLPSPARRLSFQRSEAG